jgi:trans-aconitate 2-methyltransferase
MGRLSLRAADWDAERYHRVSDPQVAWGQRVLERLAPRPGERVLDLGCGTGRLTAAVAARTCVLVVGADRSAAMLARAAGQPIGHTAFLLADGTALPFAEAFDAVFSTATFHWIRDHDALFAQLRQALRPGGRLVAQWGGGANLARLLDRARALMADPRLAPAFDAWSEPWYFAGVPDTRARLASAGFGAIEVWLEPAPTSFADAAQYAEFVTCVPLRHHLAALPDEARVPFVRELAAAAGADDPPYTLDYWRLNVDAVKPS